MQSQTPAENAMHTELRYRRAAVAGGVGIWEWNLSTGEFYVDPVLIEILGYQDDEIGNRTDVWERLVHADDRAAVAEWAQAHSAFLRRFQSYHHSVPGTRWLNVL